MTKFSKRSHYKYKRPISISLCGFNLSLFTAQFSSLPLKFSLLLPIVEFQIKSKLL